MIFFKRTGQLDEVIASQKEKTAQIVAQGPLLAMYQGDRRRDRPLPPRPLKVYDMQGFKTKLSFETNGLFARSKKGATERIFYEEIRLAKLLPLPGHQEEYAQLAIDTTFGPRMYYFIPRAYTNVICKILPNCQCASQ
jgi:hypothetical protein